MHPIVMLFCGTATRKLIRETLAGHYTLVEPERPPEIRESVDLCIVDMPGLAQLENWIHQKKVVEWPLDFPILLATTVNNIPQHHFHIDALIMVPFEPAVLLAQVNVLSRTRDLTRQLQSQAERLASVSKAVESTSDAISIADSTGKAVYLNRAFTNLYGFRVDELNIRGIPESLFVNPHIAEEILSTIHSGQSWSGEVVLKTKMGRLVPTLLRADSITNDAGRHIGIITVHTDITERKKVEATLLQQRAFERALRDIVITLISTLDLDDILDRILENVGRVVSHDMAYVVLSLNESARVVRGTGITNGQAADWLSEQDWFWEQDAELDNPVRTGQPIIVTQAGDTWHRTHPSGLHGVQSYIAAPIQLRGKVAGFLFLGSRAPGYFTKDHADRLQVFANHAAIALQNAQLFEQARELAAMKERQRLARELHDAVSQTLYSATVIAEALPILWERDPEKAKSRLAQLHRITRGALAEMRTLLLELRPSVLADAKLEDLLQQLAETLQGRTNIAVALHIDVMFPVPHDVKTQLFYITQEALNNVVKHADATHVTVSLDEHTRKLELSIVDNGRGFDPYHNDCTTSMGLSIMRERAETIGAQFQLMSQADRGTRVVVQWPLPERNTHD